MANPQPDEFTRISNELLEHFAKIRIPGEAIQVLFVILRKTYGFNKKKDRISLSQFSNFTGIKKSNCHRAVNKLEKMKIITVEREANSSIYSIQKDYDLWLSVLNTDDTLQPSSVLNTDNASVLNTDDEVYSILSTSVINTDNNKRKFKESLKKSTKERETFLTSSKITSEKIKSLFVNHSKISDPNKKNHIDPILKILENIPPELNSQDVSLCLISVFSKLQKNKGVRMDFLLENIRKSISVKHEEVLLQQKQKKLREAEKDRLKKLQIEKRKQIEEAKEFRKQKAEKIIKYSKFFNENQNLFTTKEKYEVKKSFENKSIMLIETLILGKMKIAE